MVFFLVAALPIVAGGVFLVAPSGNLIHAALLLVGGGLVTVVSLVDAHRCARRVNTAEFEQERKSSADAWRTLFWSRVFPPLGYATIGRRWTAVAILGLMIVLGALPEPSSSFALAVFLVAVCHQTFMATPMKRSASRLALYGILVYLALNPLLALVVRAHVFQAFRVPAASMEPTLRVEDRFFAQKFGRQSPQRRELIVFKSPTDGQLFVKRCVAVAGDTVEVSTQTLRLNGEIQEEPYALYRNRRPSTSSSRGPFAVPEGHFYVLGDNRDNSIDSRHWGPVPVESVVGRVHKIYWPLSRIGALR